MSTVLPTKVAETFPFHSLKFTSNLEKEKQKIKSLFVTIQLVIKFLLFEGEKKMEEKAFSSFFLILSFCFRVS